MRLSPLKTRMLLAAAVASVGVAGASASGGLLIDLQAAGVNNVDVGPGNRKNIFVNVGDTVTFNVVARVSGTNSVQQIGNFDNATPATDTRNDDSIHLVTGAFSSVGTLKGDFQGGANANQNAGDQVSPWNSTGSTNGIAQDFDSDGDLDLGAVGTDVNSMWYARAATEYTPTVSNRTTSPQTRVGVSVSAATGAGAAFMQDLGGPNTMVPATRIIDATAAETLLGELTWIVTSASGTAAVNFIPRGGGAAALWFEDGITTGKTPDNSPLTVGSPVTVGVPEPTAATLIGLLAPALLARRARTRQSQSKSI